ncbi:MAG: PQQ-binding-like beta-propeller repeat protein [Acidobacteriota bacterium]
MNEPQTPTVQLSFRPSRLVSCSLAGILVSLGALAQEWPQFRGQGARGVDDSTPLPVRWDSESGEGILWRTAIPGLGHSSPVIWGDKVFLTTAVSEKDDAGIRTGLYGDIDPVKDDSSHRFVVYCLDRNTGEVRWQKTAVETVPQVKRHLKSTHANPTVATDGKHLVAFFGSEGLYVYDLNGNLLWKKNLGLLDSGFFLVPSAQWGFGSSPVLEAGRIIVQADVQKGSFLAALDVKDGKELWRTSRDEVPTWSTPTVHDDGRRKQVIVNGFRHIGGYDFNTGAELWRMAGTGDIPTPTPFVVDDLIYLTSSHGGGSPIYVIPTNASGTLEPEQLAWSRERGGSYLPTTIVYDGLYYVGRDNGVLGVYDAKSGKRHYEARVGGGSYSFVASPVAGDGKLYYSSEDGVIFVLAAGKELNILAENDIGGRILASPAIADGTLYLRTLNELVAVRGAAAPPPAAGEEGDEETGEGETDSAESETK